MTDSAYTGTVASLVKRYQFDAGSPYDDLAQSAARQYDVYLRRMVEAFGAEPVSAMTEDRLREVLKECSVQTKLQIVAVWNQALMYGAGKFNDRDCEWAVMYLQRIRNAIRAEGRRGPGRWGSDR
jgi:hypothetical protein